MRVGIAHTRIWSILRKAGDPEVAIDPTVSREPAERALALELDAYRSILTEVSDGATLWRVSLDRVKQPAELGPISRVRGGFNLSSAQLRRFGNVPSWCSDQGIR